MAISESILHPYIKGLVEEYGSLTVTDLNKLLREILSLDADDLAPLSGRSDDKFSQIVRNVVAHSPDGISSKHGYIIDKTTTPSTFYAKINNNVDPIKSKISKVKIEERQKRKKRFIAKKVNFDALNTERSLLGDLGETFALDWERNRLKDLKVSFDLLEEVVHVSKQYGDGAGYDILSRKDEGFELLYIEVKTTKGDLNTPFYMMENERTFMRIYQKDTLIYRVYNYNPETNIGEVERIDYATLQRDYVFNPITYKVTKK